MNDIEVYVDIIRKEFKECISTIFNNSYNQNIFDRMINEYIDARYFDIDENIYDKEVLNERVLNQVGNKMRILRSTYTGKEVDDLIRGFSYIMELEQLDEQNEIESVISKIVEFRKNNLYINNNSDFSGKFSKIVKKYKEQKNNYIDRFNVEFFELDKKVVEGKNIEIVKLNYKNIPFPKTFNESSIEKEFNNNVIGEDKLLVEYRMVNALILRSIIGGLFKKEYIVEFTSTILNKKNKLDRLLKLISNDCQMERFNILIEYKDFSDDNKPDFYALMRQGYRFAIKLDDSFDINGINVDILDVFSYIIITDNTNNCDELLNNEIISKKIIKI